MAYGVKYKSFIIVFFLFALSLVTIAFCVDKASAAQLPDKANYKYFEDPVGIFADKNAVYLAENNGALYSFDSELNQSKQQLSFSASDLYFDGELIIGLNNDVIYYMSLGQTKSISNVKAYTVYRDKLYVLKDNAIIAYSIIDNEINENDYYEVSLGLDAAKISNLSAAKDGIFMTVESNSNRHMDDIYFFKPAESSLREVFSTVNKVSRLKSSPETDGVYTLSRDGLTYYNLIDSRLKIQAALNTLSVFDFSVNNGTVYTLTYKNAVEKYSFDFKNKEELLLSAGAEKGFFDSPSAISSRRGQLYVADTLNNRIQIVGSEISFIPFQFFRPSAIAVDSAGNVYVAHDYDKIEIFDVYLNHKQTITADGGIDSVKVTADDALYVLINGKIYAKTYNATDLTVFYDSYPVTAIGAAADSRHIHYATNDKIFLPNGSEIELNAPVISFAIDAKNNHFTIDRDNNIIKYAADGTSNKVSRNFEIGKAADIIISAANLDFVKAGDLVICDNIRHYLPVIDGKTAGVNIVDNDYDLPLEEDNTSLHPLDPNPEYGIIRKTTAPTELFKYPTDTMPATLQITADRNVIVVDYDVDNKGAYSYVLVDDLISNKLIAGYVYKASLSSAIAYAAPPDTVGKVINNHIAVYRYPSQKSNKIEGYVKVPKGTKLELLSFVPSYHDVDGSTVIWYRVKIGGGEGFVMNSLSLLNYDPEMLRPQTNATIKSQDGIVDIAVFESEDSDNIIATLKVGDKIEVIGSFDANKKYTQIKYFLKDFGTLSGFVETKFIDYNGITLVQIVAISLIVLTLALGAVIIIRIIVLKKHR